MVVDAADPASATPTPLIELHPALATVLMTGGIWGHSCCHICVSRVPVCYWRTSHGFLRVWYLNVPHLHFPVVVWSVLIAANNSIFDASSPLICRSLLIFVVSIARGHFCRSHQDLWMSRFFSVSRSQSIRLALKRSLSIHVELCFVV